MKQWFVKFWDLHGDRVFFLFVVFFMGGLFIVLGQWVLKGPVGEQLTGAGIVLLTSVASIALNKARSPEKDDAKPKVQ